MANRWLHVSFLLGAALFCAVAVSFVLLGVKWPTPAATMHVNIPGASPSGVPWNQAFGQAAGYWNASTAFEFNLINEFSDPCAGITVPEDRRNGTAFAANRCGTAFGSGTLAVTLVYSNTRNGQIVEADVIFNSNDVWDVYSGPWRGDVSDFRRVAAHELGHVLGLDHEDKVPALMATFIRPGDTIEQPTADDISGVSAMYGGGSTTPPPTANILLNIEEPAVGEVKTGVANLRGWVVSANAINRVELYIDGAFISNVPVGGRRSDVGAAFPNFPNSGNSGFSMAFNYSNLTPGQHTIVLRAFDNGGGTVERSASFNVARFDNPFIADQSAVSLGSASVSSNNNSIVINNLNAGGVLYNVTLEWRAATQSYEMVRIQRVSQ